MPPHNIYALYLNSLHTPLKITQWNLDQGQGSQHVSIGALSVSLHDIFCHV